MIGAIARTVLATMSDGTPRGRNDPVWHGRLAVGQVHYGMGWLLDRGLVRHSGWTPSRLGGYRVRTFEITEAGRAAL